MSRIGPLWRKCHLSIYRSVHDALDQNWVNEASVHPKGFQTSGSSVYFDEDGKPLIITASPHMFHDQLGSHYVGTIYPFYNPNNFLIPSQLINIFEVNSLITQLSPIYGIRITDLYQLTGLIIQDMPHLPIENILSMLHRLAEAIDLQKQMVSSTSNKSPLKTSVSVAEMKQYLPSDIPPEYINMLIYLDSMVPQLYPDTLAAIKTAVYANCPPSMMNSADVLLFKLRTAIRYMFAVNEMQWIPNYQY